MRTTMKTIFRLGLTILALSLAGCGLLLENEDDESDPSWTEFDAMGLPELRLTADNYADCSELQADMRHVLEERRAIDRRQREYYDARRDYNDKKGTSSQVNANSRMEDEAGSDGAGAAEPMIADDDADMAGGDGGEETFTNVQVDGVDEADTTKIGAEHIYVQVGNQITVADRKTFAEIGTMETANSQLAMYAKGKYLVLLANENTTKTVCAETKTDDGIFTQVCDKKPVQGTHVEVYTAAKGKMPTLKSEHQIDGNYFDSRLIDNRVVLAINTTMTMKPGLINATPQQEWRDEVDWREDEDDDWREDEEWDDGIDEEEWDEGEGNDSDDSGADWQTLNLLAGGANLTDEEEVPAEPVTLDEDGKVAGVPCNKIARPALPDLDFRISKIAALDLNSGDVDLTAVLGGGDQIYMSSSSIFVAKSGSQWPGWVSPTAPSAEREAYYTKLAERRESSIITEVAIKDKLAVKAHGSVLGLIVDQWSWNHYASGQVAIFTHTRQASDSQQLENHLYVLKQEGPTLKAIAAIKNFGHAEDLKAARYVGDKAYAITFRQTDPLFVFDMKDPEKPAMLGELEIPGFSAYLHPIAQDRMIGVGFGNGVEVNLFDVSDPMAPERIDVLPVGASNAEVTANHRAFFIDEKRKRFGFGFQSGYRTGIEDTFDDDEFAKERYTDSGAFILEVVDDKIVKKAMLSHRTALLGCYGRGDISRMYNLDDRFVTISAMGIVAYQPDDLASPVKKAGFGDCVQQPEAEPQDED